LAYHYNEILWPGTGCEDNVVMGVKNTPIFGIVWTRYYFVNISGAEHHQVLMNHKLAVTPDMEYL